MAALQKSLPVSESYFQDFVACYCSSGQLQEASRIMVLMHQSGLRVGRTTIQAHSWMAVCSTPTWGVRSVRSPPCLQWGWPPQMW